MTATGRRLLGGWLLWGLLAAPAQAQTAERLFRSGVEAYDQLQYPAAVASLRQALAAQGPGALLRPSRRQALAYLAAAWLFSGDQAAAAGAVEQLLEDDPRYRPSELIFPPEMSRLFEDVASRLRAVAVELPPDTAIQPGVGRWSVRLASSAPQDLEVSVTNEGGDTVSRLHRGAVQDTLTVAWNGLDERGLVAPTGRYWLRVRAARESRWPLDLRLDAPGPLPLPGRPDSLLRPERAGWGSAVGALATGAGAAGFIAFGPALLAPDRPDAAARFAVVGVVGLATVAALLVHRPLRVLPANARANRMILDRWQADHDSVQAENRRRRDAARLFIHAGPAATGAGER